MSFSRPGAIDLSALKQPATPAGQTAAPGTFVVNVTEQNFQQIALEASLQHVVVLSLWSGRAPQSGTFNQVLARVTESYAGQILLAQVDVDTNPAIAQAVGAKGVPFVLGLVKGQPVPLFEGIKDEAEVRALFEELIRVAAENGVTGRVSGEPAPAEEPEPVDDPRFAQADEAFAASDFTTAIAEYEKLAAQYPADDEVAERLAGVKLLDRTKDADLQAARQAAAGNPSDIAAQLLVADLDVSGGHVQDAFDRLIEIIKGLSGEERDPVRERLLELFLVVGTTDPRVSAARRVLATALY
ncbi:MAG: tetratricopeptide repeat protein [Actinomycetota bacterium]|nr:tetratricopeptide repeat protein [Actinomycetota bacterium]